MIKSAFLKHKAKGGCLFFHMSKSGNEKIPIFHRICQKNAHFDNKYGNFHFLIKGKVANSCKLDAVSAISLLLTKFFVFENQTQNLCHIQLMFISIHNYFKLSSSATR